jgi:hypothetical protein
LVDSLVSNGCAGRLSCYLLTSALVYAFGDPSLDNRLPRYPKSRGFLIKGRDHPGREINIYPMWIPSWSARTRDIQLSGDIFARVKLGIELTRLHKALPPRTVIADQCTSQLSKIEAVHRHDAS